MDKDQYDEQVEWNNDLRAEIAALKAKLAEAEKRGMERATLVECRDCDKGFFIIE